MHETPNGGETAESIVKRIRESAAYIKERINKSNAGRARLNGEKAGVLPPSAAQTGAPLADTAVVLGSGLGGFADGLCGAEYIPYEDIPHFPRSTAPGHKGRLAYGSISPGAPPILCMQGRFHLYEGYSVREATWHVRVFKELGVANLILTNASGGMEPGWNVGDLMLITDHINYMFQNPLTGPNLGEYGRRFPDMTHVFSPFLTGAVKSAAARLSIPLREGVYVGFCGPSYETPAEIRMFKMLGASAVGMSTVPEAIVANHCGMRVCGISCITNYAAGILDQPLTEAEVIETAGRTGPVFQRLLRGAIEALDAPNPRPEPDNAYED